mmetsp:Transcript_8443/g.20909  ORF Transcript_8443/g.20909 Transcript_8443/m.20909 type:complete len:91 (-) Transcript_8443:77-349(-)
MDVIATSVRSGVAGVRGSYSSMKRKCLERIYIAKERFFKIYDKVTAVLTCRCRRPSVNLHVPSFGHGSFQSLRGNRPPPVYNFNRLNNHD